MGWKCVYTQVENSRNGNSTNLKTHHFITRSHIIGNKDTRQGLRPEGCSEIAPAQGELHVPDDGKQEHHGDCNE